MWNICQLGEYLSNKFLKKMKNKAIGKMKTPVRYPIRCPIEIVKIAHKISQWFANLKILGQRHLKKNLYDQFQQ